MKKLILTITLVIAVVHTSYAQPPQAFKYQAVVRDSTGQIVPDTKVLVRAGIHQPSTVGPVLVYQEFHSPFTNEFGLLNVPIGGGEVLFGSFEDIQWGNYNHFLEIEIDINATGTYDSLGTSIMYSVPYALYAGSSADSSKWIQNGNELYYNGGRVGIGTSNPTNMLHVVATGPEFGIYGESSGGYGVTGQSSAEAMAGVLGVGNSASTFGVYGLNNYGGTALLAQSADGLAGHFVGDVRFDDESPYLYFYNGNDQLAFIGFWTPTSDLNIFNKTTGGSVKLGTESIERLRIESDGDIGIGTSTPYYKLHIKDEGSGQVLHCENDVAYGSLARQYRGVYGNCVTANGGTGVSGNGGQYGVFGSNFLETSSEKYGVKGHCTDGTGTSYGVYGYAGGVEGTLYGVYGEAGSSTAGYGVYYSGGLGGSGSKNAIVKTEEGPKAVYCQESPENWFEDFGNAKITNGKAKVSIAADFLQTVTINSNHPFKVFITPNANIGNWWVEKENASFVLFAPNALDGAEFDYRVVAKRKGFEDMRLEVFEGAYTDKYLYTTVDEVPDEYKEAWLKKNANEEFENLNNMDYENDKK